MSGELKKLALYMAVAIATGCAGLGTCAMVLFQYAERPAAGQDGREKIVMVTPGQSLTELSRLLEQEGIISGREKFRWYARIRGYDRRLKAGEYALSSRMSPLAVLQAIMSGKTHLYRITIPEGYTVKQVAAVIAASDLAMSSSFIEAAADRDLLKRERIGSDSFEGYLFPDTYYFPKQVTPEKIIRTMVSRFRTVFKPEWVLKAEEIGLTIHETATLASIIEKETGAASERALISSVFHNRFRKGMRLASDPTVIYGIDDFNGNLTRKDLAAPTPYNTYVHQGLPPGPIANPGREALAAALHPADTDFLYFVAKGDGTHQFSENISDHNRAVRRYQLRR